MALGGKSGDRVRRWLIVFGVLVAALFGAGAPARAAAHDGVELRSRFCHASAPAGEPTVAQVVALPYACTGEAQGYQKGWLWLRADTPDLKHLENGWVLLVDQARFSRLRIYVQHGDGQMTVQQIDARRIGDSWSVGGYLRFVVANDERPPTALYLGFEELPSWPLIRRIRGQTLEEFAVSSRIWTLTVGTVIGLVVASLAYNLFLLRGLTDSFLRHYVTWASFVLAYALFFSNVAFFAVPEAAGPLGVRINQWLATGVSYFSVRFFTSFIEPDKLSRRYRRFTDGIAGAILITGILAPLEMVAPTTITQTLFLSCILVATVTIIVGMTLAIVRGSRAAIFYAIAWTPALLAIANRVVRDISFAPRPDLVDQLVLGTAALQTVLLAMAMADRFLRFRSERDRAHAEREEMRALAESDPLTGLYNRRGFVQRAQTIVADHPRRAGLLLLDIDHFKAVNDAHGHDVGDEVLAQVGGALAAALREGDIAGRLGGEEFGVAVPGADRFVLLGLAERVRAAVEATDLRDLLGVDKRLTVSIGVASAADMTTPSFERLYRAADQAMYRAKLGGRNRVSGHIPEIDEVMPLKAF